MMRRERESHMNFLDFSSTIPEMPFILEGLGVTLKVVAAAAVLGFLLGVLITLLKISSIKPLAWIADFYTSIFREHRLFCS